MRPSWDQYFARFAETASLRSSCTRSKVGAVVVRDKRIRATGYNDSPPGEPGCETCPRARSDVAPCSNYSSGPGRCNAVHAEANALLYCNREDLPGSTIYITRAPCSECSKLIRAAGVARIVWPEGEITNYVH